MQIDLLKQRLTIDEGAKLMPYADTVGKLTIGIGHNLTDNGISTGVQDLMFQEDVQVAIDECNTYPWFASIDEPRQMLLVCLMFNLSKKKFDGFVSMITCLKTQNYIGASDELMDSLWARQVGDRATLYVNILRSGVWPDSSDG